MIIVQPSSSSLSPLGAKNDGEEDDEGSRLLSPPSNVDNLARGLGLIKDEIGMRRR